MLKCQAEDVAKSENLDIESFLKTVSHKNTIKESRKTCRKSKTKKTSTKLKTNKKQLQKGIEIVFKGKESLEIDDKNSMTFYVPCFDTCFITFEKPYNTLTEIASYYGCYIDAQSRPFKEAIRYSLPKDKFWKNAVRKHFLTLESEISQDFRLNLMKNIKNANEDLIYKWKITHIFYENSF